MMCVFTCMYVLCAQVHLHTCELLVFVGAHVFLCVSCSSHICFFLHMHARCVLVIGLRQ